VGFLSKVVRDLHNIIVTTLLTCTVHMKMTIMKNDKKLLYACKHT